MSNDCLFCSIADGEKDADLVYEDDQIIAFHDINPQAPTHLLIVPREHIETIDDLEDHHRDLAGSLILRARRLAREYDLETEGYRLVFNCQEGAGQSVWHIHLHLLGGRSFSWPPG